MRHLVAGLGVATVLGSTAVAQSVPGFTYSGEVSLAYTEINVPGLTSPDVSDLGLDLNAEFTFGSANQFGVGLDYRGFVDLDNTDFPIDRLLVYGFYEFEFGRVSFGHVENALEINFVGDRVSFPDLLDVQTLTTIDGPLSDFFYYSDAAVYGVSYVGDYGNLTAAASLQWTDDEVFDQATIYSLAARYSVSDLVTIFAGYESLDSDALPIDDRYMIGVEGMLGPIDARLAYTYGGSFFGVQQSEVATVDLGYEVTDQIALSASYVGLFSDVIDFDLFGIGARYDLNEMFAIEANYASGTQSSGLISVDIEFFGVEVIARF